MTSAAKAAIAQRNHRSAEALRHPKSAPFKISATSASMPLEINPPKISIGALLRLSGIFNRNGRALLLL